MFQFAPARPAEGLKLCSLRREALRPSPSFTFTQQPRSGPQMMIAVGAAQRGMFTAGQPEALARVGTSQEVGDHALQHGAEVCVGQPLQCGMSRDQPIEGIGIH